MSWKERAKDLGDWVEGRATAEEERRAAEHEKWERVRKEAEQAVSEYGPRVRDVCEEFARELGARLEVPDIGSHQVEFRIEVRGSLVLQSGHIDVSVRRGPNSDPSPRVMVKTWVCTDSLAEKCLRGKSSEEVSQGYCFFLKEIEYSKVREAAYVMPVHGFTEDKLAAVLEEFCKHGFDLKAKLR